MRLALLRPLARPSFQPGLYRRAVNEGWRQNPSVNVPTRRAYSNQTSESRPSKQLNLLILAGVGLITYGTYSYIYEKYYRWPATVKANLRGGIKAKMAGDLDLSISYFRSAWDEAKYLDKGVLGSDVYKKATGVAIYLAEVLEMKKQYNESSIVLEEAYNYLAQRSASLSRADKWRKVELAAKLGDLAELDDKHIEEGRWKSRAVEDYLRGFNEKTDGSKQPMLVVSDIVPNREDQATPFMTLAWYHLRRGEAAYAIELLNKAASMLGGQGTLTELNTRSDVENICRAGTLFAIIGHAWLRFNDSDPSRLDFNTIQNMIIASVLMGGKAADSTLLNGDNRECSMAVWLAGTAMAKLAQRTGDLDAAKKIIDQLNTDAKKHEAEGSEEVIASAQEFLTEIGIGALKQSPKGKHQVELDLDTSSSSQGDKPTAQ
ncbi:hypothetical protein SISSUDRAFT_1129928 [Sistotremastrum suecicum HHB10207 ss-3]|uniref:Uncharacterized protein n=1 Tax=Sistotremastrum suecicum HHB10207 ss-3 TaxID=1314776 RepID=A0A166C338_9AGAM|nr:hypothetical protein SISSUDRAFT_1129928 [Sistotremastrum suecicum HHB10207 ss-3]